MAVVQEVTVKEFFDESIQSQKIHPTSDRLEFAKAYIKDRLKISDEDKNVVKFVMEEATKQGMSTIRVLAFYALKELHARIEDGLMEFVAEQGMCTYEALKQDAEDYLACLADIQTRGWCSPKGRKAMDELEDVVDLQIVHSSGSQVHMHAVYNPFNPVYIKEETVFKTDSELLAERIAREAQVQHLPFTITPKQPKLLKPADYDNLSEEEWKKAKEADRTGEAQSLTTNAAHLRWMI
jgi:hypothetical protein